LNHKKPALFQSRDLFTALRQASFPPHILKDLKMLINFKAAAMLAFGTATLLSGGQAKADICDGTVQPDFRGRTRQCYYLPTVSNGRVTGVQKQVNYGGTPFSSPYGHPGAVIGGRPWNHR